MEMILTDIQLLEILICAVLSFVAYRTRIATIALVPSIGFFVLGFQLYDASQDIFILALFFLMAVVSFTVTMRVKE